MTDLPFHSPDEPTPSLTGATGRKCGRHLWKPVPVRPVAFSHDGELMDTSPNAFYWICARCGTRRDEVHSRRGRSARRLGNDQERRAERRYGWAKIGERGEITDLRGRLMKVQMKATRRAAPVGWRGIFSALDAVNDGRTAAILLSFVRQGVPAQDFIVIRGEDWLALHGRDEAAE